MSLRCPECGGPAKLAGLGTIEAERLRPAPPEARTTSAAPPCHVPGCEARGPHIGHVVKLTVPGAAPPPPPGVCPKNAESFGQPPPGEDAVRESAGEEREAANRAIAARVAATNRLAFVEDLVRRLVHVGSQECASQEWIATCEAARDALAAPAAAPASPPARAPEEVMAEVDALRAEGWAVAVHNDYRLAGVPHTFWLFTRGDRCVKGEGRTDAEALSAVRRALGITDEGRKTP